MNGIVIESWYSKVLQYEGISFDSWLESKKLYLCLKPILKKMPFLRGFLLFICVRSYGGVVLTCDNPGFYVFLFLRSIFKTPGPCYVLEFIRREPRSKILKLIYIFLFKIIYYDVIKKAVTKAQVMSQWEQKRYTQMFKVDVNKFRYIPFPMGVSNSNQQLIFKNKEKMQIMASGRTSCDWKVFIDAVAGLVDCEIVIVYSKKDNNFFRFLNLPENYKLFCDISSDQHDFYLAKSSCYVISLFETNGSSGQVRLSHAIRLGIPVIVTGIQGIMEFVKNGVTALVVPPGDSLAMRKAIMEIIGDDKLQLRLAENAFLEARKWTSEQYYQRLSEFIKIDDENSAS